VAEPNKWALGADSIPAKGYKSINDQGFGLAWDGEELALSYLPQAGQGRIVDAVSFKAQESNISRGRYPDGGSYWMRLMPSQGVANADPILDLMITEILYHPIDPNDEYVELYNPTSQAIAMGGDVAWRLDGAVDYNLPAGVSIPAGGRLVIVGFDPLVETSRLTSFAAAYGVSLKPGIQLLGPWQGNLSNRGERLALEKSQAGADVTDAAGWVTVDEVVYSDVSPWPAGSDGEGESLRRIHTDATHSGNDPANWESVSPSPGIAP
jgi:hypothetical protein